MNKIVLALISLGLVASLVSAQLSTNSFQGSTTYQAGMTLDEASDLATVSKAEAITAAKTLTGVTSEALNAEITVVDGFIVWAVDLGGQLAYIDITNKDLGSTQDVMAATYMNSDDDSDDDDYKDENDSEHEDDYEDDNEHEDDYEDDDKHEDDD